MPTKLGHVTKWAEILLTCTLNLTTQQNILYKLRRKSVTLNGMAQTRPVHFSTELVKKNCLVYKACTGKLWLGLLVS